MTRSSTVTVERPTPKICKIKFANPPVNLIVPETVSRLHKVVKELSEDAHVQVVIFTSSVSDYFFNHFDLTQASKFPMLPGADAIPTWVDGGFCRSPNKVKQTMSCKSERMTSSKSSGERH